MKTRFECRRAINDLIGDEINYLFFAEDIIRVAQKGTSTTSSFSIPSGLDLRTRVGWNELLELFKQNYKEAPND